MYVETFFLVISWTLLLNFIKENLENTVEVYDLSAFACKPYSGIKSERTDGRSVCHDCYVQDCDGAGLLHLYWDLCPITVCI
mgnify:CR=1 FL=1